MRAGRLRHRVAIQSPSAATGTEGQIARQTNPRLTHRILIRYRSGITARNRILFGSRIFEVTQVVNPDMRNEHLRLLAIEEV